MRKSTRMSTGVGMADLQKRSQTEFGELCLCRIVADCKNEATALRLEMPLYLTGRLKKRSHARFAK
jgi:hypothetical protein